MKYVCLLWLMFFDSIYLVNFYNYEMICFVLVIFDVILLVVDNLIGRYEGDIGDFDDGV